MGQFGRLLAPSMLRAAATRRPERPLVRLGDATLSYGEVDQRADRLAEVLAGMGVRPGDVVAVLLPNRIEYLETYYGIARAGAACLPLLPRMTKPELVYQLEDSGAAALVADPSLLDDGLTEAVPTDRWLVLDDSDAGYEHRLAGATGAPQRIELAENDLYCIRYTSGTTGRPKGSANTQRAWWLVAHAMVAEWGILEDDVFLANGPLSHVSGMVSFAQVAAGGQVVIHERFEVESTVEALAHDGITHVFMVPTQFAMVVEELEKQARTLDGVRLLTCAAAPLSPSLKRRIQARFPRAALHEFYSATETPMVTNLRPEERAARPDSVGRIRFLGGDIQVRDDQGRALPPGKVGEIWVSNPMVHAGYHDRDDANAASLRDGYMFVGDLGRLDEEGYLYLTGRKSDLVISGGFNVYPAEVEQALAEHPDVAEACVYGVAHRTWGQEVRAAVIAADGTSPSEHDLDAWARARLADYKVPRRYRVVEDLPRLSSGKVLRRELIEQDERDPADDAPVARGMA